METLAKRLAEQNEEHHGGSRWIGTGGTSPFGQGGFNPEGVRIGSGAPRQGRAVKVWEQRRYQDLDGNRERLAQLADPRKIGLDDERAAS